VNDAPHALPPPPQESRLHRFIASAGHLVGTMVEMGFTRLELIFVEFQEWAEGLVKIFFWAMVMVFAAAMFLLLGALTLIFIFWDQRVLVASLETGAFGLLVVAALIMMKSRLGVHRSLLASTLAEFAKDRELMKRRPIPDVAAAPQAPPL
jgi:uncharacterized membrane protein YqjE